MTISSSAFSPGGGHRLHVAFEQRLERLLVLHSGCCGASALTRSSAKSDLEIDRLLGPERAVVVEDGDALGGRHEVRPALRA